MGWWSTCYQMGPLLVGPLAGLLIHAFGWRAVFRLPMAFMVGVALLVLWVVRPGPTPVGEPIVSEAQAMAERRQAQHEVLRNRVLWSYGASYFFIKFVRYALQLWLPYYLQRQLAYPVDKANTVAAALEAGGLVGVIGIGSLSDRPNLGRVPLSAASLLGLALALFAGAKLVGASTWLNVLLLGLIGALLFAPDSILCGAAAQDAGGRRATSMAAGFVNGVGSLGALLVGLAVPRMVQAYGWNVMFPSLVGMAVLSALCLIPALRADAQQQIAT